MTRLIDADSLKFSRVRIVHEDGTIGGYNAVVMSSEIKHAPTVDAVPVKHGKWKYKPYAYEWICTCCECVVEDGKPQYNYCPNCGARMDAE